jgi:hypothetical protein
VASDIVVSPHATIDHQTTSCGPTSSRTAKIKDRCSDFVSRHMPAQWNFLIVEHLARIPAQQGSHGRFCCAHECIVHRTWAHRIDGDATSCNLFRRAANQADERVFCRNVGAISRHALHTDHTGSHNDTAIVWQMRQDIAQGKKRPAHVNTLDKIEN